MNGNRTSSRLRHAIILALGLGISNFAFSLRLGPINVKSYLGQPINATIRVDGLNAGTASNTKVSLANPAAYRSHGIEMLPIHSQMRFSLVPSGKGYIIHVSSTGGVKEPFVNFLVTVSGNGSTVTREYAAFFNPNPINTSAGKSNQPTVVESNQPQKSNDKVIAERSQPPKTRSHAANTSGWGGKPAKKPVAKPISEPVRPVSESAPAQASSSSGSPNTPSSIPVGSSYGPIKPGETLYSIAKAARPNENMRIYDMMRLIYKANRRAFIGNDMGNLMAGVTLHIPDPGSRASAAKPAPKAMPKPEKKAPPSPPQVEEKSVVPQNIPTAPTAQLALGMNEEKKTEIPTPSELDIPPIPPIIEGEQKAAVEEPQEQGLRLDSPESIDNKPNIEIPPPVVELPKPEPVEEIQQPEPEPQPLPPPAPKVQKPAPTPAPALAADDSFFGLGKFFDGLGIPLPILGGAFAGLLALLGGLFWFLKKRKSVKSDDQMEEFTEEEINQLVAEMEEEHNDVNFDQVTSNQSAYDEDAEQPKITKLDPISEPYSEERGSVDELSDDFFKDLEISVDGSETDTSFMVDETITDSTEISDNFFDDIEFDSGPESQDQEHKPISSSSSSHDEFDDFLSDSSDESSEDLLANFDDNIFTEIDSPHKEESKPAAEPIDDFDDFFSTTQTPVDDFFADEDFDSSSKSDSTQSEDSGLDFLTDTDLQPEQSTPSTISDDDNSLDFFTEIDKQENQKEKETSHFSTDSFTDDEEGLDFFTTTTPEEIAPKETAPEERDNHYLEEDFFADESTTSNVELEKKENKQDDSNNSDFFSDPVSEAIPPESDVPAKPPAPSLAKPAAPKLQTPTASAAPKVDEDAMEINLDMAKSFISMGKSEKARSWLEEVLELGTEEQKVQAHKMLSNIDKG